MGYVFAIIGIFTVAGLWQYFNQQSESLHQSKHLAKHDKFTHHRGEEL
ncbi:hypothetical protein [Levilactobacillus bambusae]|nr:hypothetical protein [Levilactobacillus bambusae]